MTPQQYQEFLAIGKVTDLEEGACQEGDVAVRAMLMAGYMRDQVSLLSTCERCCKPRQSNPAAVLFFYASLMPRRGMTPKKWSVSRSGSTTSNCRLCGLPPLPSGLRNPDLIAGGMRWRQEKSFHSGVTAAMNACVRGQLEVLEKSCQQGNNPDSCTLRLAVLQGVLGRRGCQHLERRWLRTPSGDPCGDLPP